MGRRFKGQTGTPTRFARLKDQDKIDDADEKLPWYSDRDVPSYIPKEQICDYLYNRKRRREKNDRKGNS